MNTPIGLLLGLLVSINQWKYVSAVRGITSYPTGQNTVPSHQTEDFTQLASSKVLWVDRRMTYDEAERHCQDLDSNLIEIWTESEWDEVRSYV